MYKWSFKYKQGYENFPIFFRPKKKKPYDLGQFLFCLITTWSLQIREIDP
jgi:hypothetical protein